MYVSCSQYVFVLWEDNSPKMLIQKAQAHITHSIEQ